MNSSHRSNTNNSEVKLIFVVRRNVLIFGLDVRNLQLTLHLKMREATDNLAFGHSMKCEQSA